MAGLVGIQHVSSTVRDLGETLGWYRDVLGVEPFMTMEAEGPELSAGLRVPGAALDVAFLKVGGAWIELIEYVKPDDTNDDVVLRRCDHGAAHICFEVEDIQAAYQHLLAHDVDCYNEPTYVPAGPLEGAWFLYFDGPEGLKYELHQMPEGWAE
ncbi:2-epi-5-epi-valiolone epimerase [Capillimicrobium parvum]|uniref:2-epi-5-epi-valiolone epimerase n=2 Tax=Capillimicrobium parvum TaxID=2884022 RepID=A0A9E6XUW4_9ACTN|nr:2-epi-5-epi-valiolone epimerase [Capillimicrobium parvum]